MWFCFVLNWQYNMIVWYCMSSWDIHVAILSGHWGFKAIIHGFGDRDDVLLNRFGRPDTQEAKYPSIPQMARWIQVAFVQLNSRRLWWARGATGTTVWITGLSRRSLQSKMWFCASEADSFARTALLCTLWRFKPGTCWFPFWPRQPLTVKHGTPHFSIFTAPLDRVSHPGPVSKVLRVLGPVGHSKQIAR